MGLESNKRIYPPIKGVTTPSESIVVFEQPPDAHACVLFRRRQGSELEFVHVNCGIHDIQTIIDALSKKGKSKCQF